MREAGAPSTGEVCAPECARPPGQSWSHHRESRATWRGRQSEGPRQRKIGSGAAIGSIKAGAPDQRPRPYLLIMPSGAA